VVINKIDRKDARAEEVLEAVYELFLDLGVGESVFDMPILYAIAKDGIAKRSLEETSTTLEPLFETILEHVPPPMDRAEEPLRAAVIDTDYDDYVGRIAVGRIESGAIKYGANVTVIGSKGAAPPARIMRLYTHDGVKRVETKALSSGDLFALAGLENVEIGDTLTDNPETKPMPRVAVEPPTITMTFMVNDSPFAGKEGKYLTSRQIGERLMKASAQNVSLEVHQGVTPDRFEVFGRGELQLAVLVEAMRREGYEVQLSKPEVVTKEIDGKLHEPMELVVIDVPEEHIGTVTESLGNRLGRMANMDPPRSGRVRLEFRIPSRGLIGYRSRFLTETRGTGILTSVVDGWAPYLGPIGRRATGALVADRPGKTTPYALFSLEPRGTMFVPPNTPVYEGMIVGEHKRDNDLDVNICREKKLTNIRAAGKDENVALTPHRKMSLEQVIEFIDDDELAEVTPTQIRLRKKLLACNIRPKRTAFSELNAS
jgi:GTP-binding protein